MRKLITTSAALSALLIAAVPVGAQTPELYDACDNTAGATVIAASSSQSFDVDTSPTPLFLTNADAGTYIIDLEGQEVGSRQNVDLTLSSDGGTGVEDHDLIVNGVSSDEPGMPETTSLSNVAHCTVLDLETNAFLSTAIETLSVRIRTRA